MVMEAPPSPQSVGREFVRQYYTLLNKAPTHLHRFYNNQSSFVHGGLDPPNRETSPVIGQKQIHQKIQQLNFRDCHAKITQVDSQATLGSGVVVQVTGELSNAGQPMRRFTQTFVLAAQSPKKYYVHNDIFRYQDEIISDEECEGDVRSDQEEDVPERQVLDVQQLNQPMPPYYQGAAPIQAQVQALHHNPPPPPHVLAQPVQVPPTVNGAVHPEDLNVLQAQVAHVAPVQPPLPIPAGLQQLPLVQQQQQQQPLPPTLPIDEPQQPQQQLLDEPVEEINETVYNDMEQEQEQDQELVCESSLSSEPKTWANLLKSPSDKGSPYGGSHPSLPPLSQPIRSTSPPSIGNPALGQRNNQNNRNNGPRAGLNQQQQQQQQPRPPRPEQSRDSLPGRNMMYDVGGDERRRSQGMSFSNDVNQLFLGNLPHVATEDDLRDIFSEFGNILDLRVHHKPNPKTTPGARATPNYGFITYEFQQAVQACLAAKPIFYPKDDKNGVMLNVEEKKLKDKQPYSNNRTNPDNRGGSRGGDNNGPRRMGPGPNRNNMGPGGGGPTNNGPNRSYNRTGGGGGGGSGGGGPPNRPQNTYNNRR